jgi:tetratricopeptide (TPR) repeat protein
MGELGPFICWLAVVGFLAILLAPIIAHYGGIGLSNFLDPHHWTSAEEEIALRPIRRLVDKDQYLEALDELDKLLQKHKPTYESLLIKAKLLHHFGRIDETVAALLSLIELSKTTVQQLAVMELLALLEEHHQDPPKPFTLASWQIQIHHELILFPTLGGASPGHTSALHKEIPPAVYQVEVILHRNRRWLKLAGEDWGNAEMCWEAIQSINRPTAAPRPQGFFGQILRMPQAIAGALKRKPRRQLRAEAQELFQQANQLIRHDDWQNAVPLLQQASACDPDRYEIAYRWVQAVRHTSSDATTAQAVSQVLTQSRWTESEQEMLHQLQRPA